jgi:hypothetical protein
MLLSTACTKWKPLKLCLAALHGGYFLRRQYNAFLECQRGGNADRLIEKGVLQGHIRVHESAA